jgi:DNA-binding MarR family transcriptional regulator
MRPDIPLGGLISIIYRNRIIYLNAELKKFGITASGFSVLMYLSQEQNVIQDDIARGFRIDKSAIARAVQKLENAGFVRRIVEPSNRRASHLFLTEKGNEIIPEIVRIDKLWEEMALAGASEEKRSQVYSLLGRMVQNSLIIAGNCSDE